MNSSFSDRLWGNSQMIVGPMVRANSLPFRLACLDYGADVVYSEELLAARAINCKRVENSCLNTIDFIRSHKTTQDVVFRTHIKEEREESRCVLQLGASDGSSALKAAKIFERDVAAIDVNMGCPKHYAVSAGMGSQLMCTPEIAEDIIKTLKRNLSIPISVKTRIFCAEKSKGSGLLSVDEARTVEWVQRLQMAGADAIALHSRAACEKTSVQSHDEVYSLVHNTLRNSNTYMICNGDIWCHEDIQRINDSLTYAGGSLSTERRYRPCFMLARPALWNPAVFQTIRQQQKQRAAFSNAATSSVEEHGTGAYADLLTGTPSLCTDAPPLRVADRASNDLMVEVLATVIRRSAESANCLQNTKFVLQNILAGSRKLNSALRDGVREAKNIIELSRLVGCEADVVAEHRRQILYYTSAGGGGEQPLPSRGQGLFTGCEEWPGIVAKTCHVYLDSYFDDNYYTAFRKATRQSGPSSGFSFSNSSTSSRTEQVRSSSKVVATATSSCSRHKFKYATFAETTSVVVVPAKRHPK